MKTTRPINSNAAIEAKFSKALQELCAEMEHSVNYWVLAAYKKRPPKLATLIAQDASTVTELNRVFKELGKRWIGKFDDLALAMATKYMGEQFKASENAFQQSLIAAGWAVKFTASSTVQEALKASIAETVSLIKSIPAQHLKDIEGLTMRSVMAGRDLEMFTKELKEKYGSTPKRAELIARNQCNAATATVRQAKALEQGITTAKWAHSNAGKEPRKSHVAANGKIFNVADGLEVDGAMIQPGQLINCRCSCRFILPV